MLATASSFIAIWRPAAPWHPSFASWVVHFAAHARRPLVPAGTRVSSPPLLRVHIRQWISSVALATHSPPEYSRRRRPGLAPVVAAPSAPFPARDSNIFGAHASTQPLAPGADSTRSRNYTCFVSATPSNVRQLCFSLRELRRAWGSIRRLNLAYAGVLSGLRDLYVARLLDMAQRAGQRIHRLPFRYSLRRRSGLAFVNGAARDVPASQSKVLRCSFPLLLFCSVPASRVTSA